MGQRWEINMLQSTANRAHYDNVGRWHIVTSYCRHGCFISISTASECLLWHCLPSLHFHMPHASRLPWACCLFVLTEHPNHLCNYPLVNPGSHPGYPKLSGKDLSWVMSTTKHQILWKLWENKSSIYCHLFSAIDKFKESTPDPGPGIDLPVK